MKNTLKRIASMMMALCLMTGSAMAASVEDDDEDWDMSAITTEAPAEEAEAEEETADVDEETEEEDDGEFIIDDETQAAIDALQQDMEVDTTTDADALDLNTNLPDNVINILLIGIDTRDTSLTSGLQQGDVQIILSINKDTGAIKLTSLLRDMYVTIPGYKNKNRINVSYARGGGQLAMRTVNKNFEMNIQSYVTINFYGLASIIDAIGGIDIDLTKKEASAINTYLKKHPPKYDNTDGSSRVALEKVDGVQHLDGVQAVMYARLRKIDNDFGRTARQRHLLELLLEKVMQDMTLDKMMTLIETCVPYVSTNMNPSTMVELGMTVLNSGIISRAQAGETLLEQHRVPMDGCYSYKDINGASVIYLSTNNLKKNVQSIHEFIYGQYYAADAE